MTAADIHNALLAAVSFLEEHDCPYALMGALSLGFYGNGRATHDVDIMITGDSDRLRLIRSLAAAGGFLIDEVWEQCHADVRDVQLRMVLNGVPIDFMLPRDAHDRTAHERRREFRAIERKVWVVSPEDIVLQKLKAGRPHDFDDAIALFTSCRERLDHAYLNDWATRLGVREELDFLWSRSETARQRPS